MSLLLSVLIIMCSMLTISAEEPTIEEVASSGYEWTFKVKADVGGRMNAMITGKKDKDSTAQRVYDIERETGVLKDGNYEYTFTFTMPEDAPSLLGPDDANKYEVRIGNNVPKYSEYFSYVSIAGRIDFYGSIGKLEKADQVRPLLFPDGIDEDPNPDCSIDLKDYKGLNTAIMDIVDKGILDIKSEFESIDSNLSQTAKLEAMEGKFNTKKLKEIIRIATFEYNSARDWNGAVQACFDDSIFDDKYFVTEDPTSEAVDEKFQLDKEDVKTYFATEKEGIALNKDAYSEAFDKATTVAIINEAIEKNYTQYIKHAVMAALKADHPALFESATYLSEALDKKTKIGIWDGFEAGLDTFTDCDDLISKLDVLAQNTVGGGETSEPSDDNLPPEGSTTTTPQRPSGTPGGFVDVPTIKPTPSDPKPVDPKPSEPEEEQKEPESPSTVFADMKGFDWAVEAVEYFAEKGVISGKEEGKFAPADGVTREQGAKIITLAFGLYNENIDTLDFADVSSDSWSARYVASAVAAGIFQGYGESFGATDILTREQGATVLYRLLVELGYEFTTEPKEFTDDADVADYAKEAVSMLAGTGVIDGMGDGTFSPKTPLNRAQLAALAYRVVQLTIS